MIERVKAETWMRASVVTVVCAIGSTGGTAQPARGVSGGEYRNTNYGYAVRLPEGITIETTEAPAPSHGFGVMLNGGGQLWVDGSLAESAKTLQEALGEQRRATPSRCREVSYGK